MSYLRQASFEYLKLLKAWMVMRRQWVRPRWHLLYKPNFILQKMYWHSEPVVHEKMFSALPPAPFFSDSESIWVVIKKSSVFRWIHLFPIWKLFMCRFWCVLVMQRFQRVLQTRVPNDVLCLGAHFWCLVTGVIICWIMFFSFNFALVQHFSSTPWSWSAYLDLSPLKWVKLSTQIPHVTSLEVKISALMVSKWFSLPFSWRFCGKESFWKLMLSCTRGCFGSSYPRCSHNIRGLGRLTWLG